MRLAPRLEASISNAKETSRTAQSPMIRVEPPLRGSMYRTVRGNASERNSSSPNQILLHIEFRIGPSNVAEQLRGRKVAGFGHILGSSTGVPIERLRRRPSQADQDRT